MKILKLIIKNAFRHKLRSILTIFGIAIAVIAFGVMRTVVTSYYAAYEAASKERLVTRHSVSFIFQLPFAYVDKIKSVPGVDVVTWANWFGGVYKDKNNFFARMAVDAETFFDVFPEYILSEKELADFKSERMACVIGEATAKQYNIKVGDMFSLEGDIYPGMWDFVVRGIYKPRDRATDATMMVFQFDYLNEFLEKNAPERANELGWFTIKLTNPDEAANVSREIDALFKNSVAETKTETEADFAMSFMAAFSAIITSMNVVSYLIIGIILLVLANTMIMSSRERTREYAVLKTIGFTGKNLTAIILGESLVISILGGILGLLITIPLVQGMAEFIPKTVFPVFEVENITLIFAVMVSLVIGCLAAAFPIRKAVTTRIVDGFRFVG